VLEESTKPVAAAVMSFARPSRAETDFGVDGGGIQMGGPRHVAGGGGCERTRPNSQTDLPALIPCSDSEALNRSHRSDSPSGLTIKAGPAARRFFTLHGEGRT
jgi:hypothetical protein